MKLIFLVLFFFSICCSCVSDCRSKIEPPNRTRSNTPPFLRGSLIDNRYYSEDGSFSASLMGFDPSETEIFENKDAVCSSVVLSFASGPTIRYDLFPITDIKMLFALCDPAYRHEFFYLFANQMILQPFRVQCPWIELSHEEIIPVEDESYYFGLIHGAISREVNYATGQRSNDYGGVLIGMKGPNVLVIQLQKGSQTYQSKETALEELLPRLRYLFDECFVETSFEVK